MKNARFPQTLLATLCVGYLSAFTTSAHAKHHEMRYLDAGIWKIVVTQKDCFHAAPGSLLKVSPIGTVGNRTYRVSQFFDRNIMRTLYETPLDDQIERRAITGEKFCRGIVSISDMNLPITKSDDAISDANDGLLLIDAARHAMAPVMQELQKMTTLATQAASGTYSSVQLSQLNNEFQAHMAAIQHAANTKRFNRVMLMDGSNESVDIAADKGQTHITIPLSNFSTGSAGLNIAALSIDSAARAQDALSTLSSITAIETEYSALKAAEIQLTAAAKRDAITTFVDETTDDFTVQIKVPARTTRG